MPHSPVSDNERRRAIVLRRSMTRAETLLWRYLKAGRLHGLSFRRQTPMGRYIADFVCHAARVVVEVDGETHDFDDQIRRDARRDALPGPKWLGNARDRSVNDCHPSIRSILLPIHPLDNDVGMERIIS